MFVNVRNIPTRKLLDSLKKYIFFIKLMDINGMFYKKKVRVS